MFVCACLCTSLAQLGLPDAGCAGVQESIHGRYSTQRHRHQGAPLERGRRPERPGRPISAPAVSPGKSWALPLHIVVTGLSQWAQGSDGLGVGAPAPGQQTGEARDPRGLEARRPEGVPREPAGPRLGSATGGSWGGRSHAVGGHCRLRASEDRWSQGWSTASRTREGGDGPCVPGGKARPTRRTAGSGTETTFGPRRPQGQMITSGEPCIPTKSPRDAGLGGSIGLQDLPGRPGPAVVEGEDQRED